MYCKKSVSLQSRAAFLFSCCNKISFCMHLGIDSSKLLLVTSEEQNHGAQPALPGCPFTGTNHLRGRGTPVTTAYSALNSHSRKQGLCRDESLLPF